jgi:tripartite-type tricarboxylate transporter receptor subunit TctC
LSGPVFSYAAYYEGKTLKIIKDSAPGGFGDARSRAVLAFLPKYIPGNPTIVSEYMPGGGGRKASNFFYARANPDGFTVLNSGAGMITNAVLGATGVQYDINRFIYLGSANSRQTDVFLTRKDLNLSTLEKLRSARGLKVGAQSVGHYIYMVGRLFAWLLDLKDPKFVTGYGGQEIDVALLQGEVDARGQTVTTMINRASDWLSPEGPVNFHSAIDVPKNYRDKHPAIDHLPAIDNFARTEVERKVIETLRSLRHVGTPYMLPPGTPNEVVAILRAAFRGVFRDQEFLENWRKSVGDEASPIMGDEQAEVVKNIPREPAVLQVFRRIAGPDDLPSR